MAYSDSTIYTCTECGANLNLSAANLYPPDFFFEAGNKGTVSFAAVDTTKFRFEKEDKIRPFFETRNYWGIQRTRTKIKCNGCGRLVGHVYDDGPPMTDSPGQFHMGPSQEEDYRRFEESLNDDGKGDKDSFSAANDSNKNASDNEVRVGIKDWWTKCNYAYLNQPAIESSVDPPKRRTSTFVPNCFPYTPAPLYRTSVGVL